VVPIDAYRLWERWQQMHYPVRPVPAGGPISTDLVALDGKAGVVLERYFRRGSRARALDAESRATLERCRFELGMVSGGLSSDAQRYFGRLLDLIELALAADASPTLVNRRHPDN
jgi:hypothetical protein